MARRHESFTVGQHRQMKELWALGATAEHIAEEIGHPVGSVYSHAVEYREDFPQRRVRRDFTWDEVRTMREMWAEDRTAMEIAEAVGRGVQAVYLYASRHREDFPKRKGRRRRDGCEGADKKTSRECRPKHHVCGGYVEARLRYPQEEPPEAIVVDGLRWVLEKSS